MFLHWLGRVEKKRGDYKLHNFVTNRPSLLNSIESFGNHISQEILLNEDLGQVKQPGLLSNTKLMVTLDYQPPHWDFIGWRDVKAHDMPWVVHVPLCREGMMLHVWLTMDGSRRYPGQKCSESKYLCGQDNVMGTHVLHMGTHVNDRGTHVDQWHGCPWY
mgnify:CR=1 FL=1